MNRQKRIIGLCIVFSLILATCISAYVPVQIEGKIKFKFYEDIHKEKCIEIFNSIPEKYKEGISHVKVFGAYTFAGGRYWWQQASIDLFDNCNKKVIIHELAHHCQYKKGDTLNEAYNHQGEFKKCEAEIWKNLKEE